MTELSATYSEMNDMYSQLGLMAEEDAKLGIQPSDTPAAEETNKNIRIHNERCPYCDSSDVDWGLDSDTSYLKVIDTALCMNCNKMWEMIYVFSEWRPIDD